MIDAHDLARRDLRDLAVVVAEQASTWTGEPSEGWHFLIELFTSRLASADRECVVRDLSLLRRAYEMLLDAALADGALDGRENAVRRINMLVALAAISDVDAEIDDLAASAKQLALRNVSVPLKRAQVAARNWRALPADEIREMRHAKNLLGPLVPLVGRGLNSDDSAEVDAWLRLLPLLP